ncbi:general odorant-binding protein 19a-like, partial [Teleopsis dalmanni]|uniref:general odorant-binding protein 19a-like n=1 Tax=Teleopsis dalmanni TaxID=139649 RepID=UPI0018CE77E2
LLIEIAANIRNGIIPDDTDTKCYINCIMEMMQTIKKGKFLYDGALKQVDILLPEDYKDEYRTGITACKTAAVGVKNHCEAAYILLNCLRGKITKFVFP